MDTAGKLLKSITKWAKVEDEIRVMVLLGSRVRKSAGDRMSDINLDLFVTDLAVYLEREDWLQLFGTAWLSTVEVEVDLVIRKVVYEDSPMVEFYFQPLEILAAIGEQLPPYYQPYYQVLVDKDKLTGQFSKAKGEIPAPESPTPEYIQAVLEQFWLDAYHAVKYLWRGELWRTKHYDWNLKQHLLRMMGWHAVVCRGESNFSVLEGKDLQAWTDPETYTALMTTFGRFYPADSWHALEETVKLFTRLAKDVAGELAVPYPQEWETKFTALAKELVAHPKE